MKNYFVKFLFVKIFLFINISLLAPARPALAIIYEQPADPFRALIYAIGMVETSLDTLAYNPYEEAVGFFQIRPVRLEDYNKRTGSDYKIEDLYNYSVAGKIFLYYASKIGPYNFEMIAKNWNGSGPMTITYWNKVRKYLI
jgi:hypothetical protein